MRRSVQRVQTVLKCLQILFYHYFQSDCSITFLIVNFFLLHNKVHKRIQCDVLCFNETEAGFDNAAYLKHVKISRKVIRFTFVAVTNCQCQNEVFICRR